MNYPKRVMNTLQDIRTGTGEIANSIETPIPAHRRPGGCGLRHRSHRTDAVRGELTAAGQLRKVQDDARAAEAGPPRTVRAAIRRALRLGPGRRCC